MCASQIASALIDLEPAHSWPKMGLPRVRSREDARKRSLMRKEKRKEKQKTAKQLREGKPQAKRPPPAAVADVLEGVGVLPQTAEKVGSPFHGRNPPCISWWIQLCALSCSPAAFMQNSSMLVRPCQPRAAHLMIIKQAGLHHVHFVHAILSCDMPS